jgi:hypothetical protein
MIPRKTAADTRPVDEIEALDRSRRHMLVTVIVASTASMLPWILRGALGESLPPTLNTVLILVGVAGAVAYVVFMMRFHRFQTRVHGDPALRARLDDERVLALRREAISRGWLVLVVVLGLGVAVAPFAALPDQAVLMVLLLVAVNAPIGFFLFLDRG